MQTSAHILSGPITLDEMEERFSKAVTGIVSIFELGSCLDTIPDLPTGKP